MAGIEHRVYCERHIFPSSFSVAKHPNLEGPSFHAADILWNCVYRVHSWSHAGGQAEEKERRLRARASPAHCEIPD